jgi:2-keto-3-deoxy-L-rhamnonate aldolase RhmA
VQALCNVVVTIMIEKSGTADNLEKVPEVPGVDMEQRGNEAKYFLDMGVRHFCIGTDINILYNWCRQHGDALRKALSGA